MKLIQHNKDTDFSAIEVVYNKDTYNLTQLELIYQ